jgi:hypothetical protein
LGGVFRVSTFFLFAARISSDQGRCFRRASGEFRF